VHTTPDAFVTSMAATRSQTRSCSSSSTSCGCVPALPGGAAQPGSAGITVTTWHNVAFDGQGRPAAMLDGYQSGDPVVRAFAYQADPGRPAEEIADEAFDIFNDHPRDPGGADLACAYYGRRLRSLSFPGNPLLLQFVLPAHVRGGPDCRRGGWRICGHGG
jgi:hypothetical protein